MEYRPISSSQAQYRLLYVGSDLGLLKFVQDELKYEGCFVVRCPDGGMAQILLSSGIHYDLLLFDEEVAGTSGLELVRWVRTLEHRARTPLILLSLRDRGIEARRAGADKLLRKPEHLFALAETVRRLLDS